MWLSNTVFTVLIIARNLFHCGIPIMCYQFRSTSRVLTQTVCIMDPVSLSDKTCCRGACQNSDWSDNSKYKSRGFETLRDLTISRCTVTSSWITSLVLPLRSDVAVSRLANGSAAFIWKLRVHWLRDLRQRHTTRVIKTHLMQSSEWSVNSGTKQTE